MKTEIKWIDINDQEPAKVHQEVPVYGGSKMRRYEQVGPVLVANGLDVFVAYWCFAFNKDWMFLEPSIDDDGAPVINNVTHWAYMPDSPPLTR
jgi:hypothetical protein